MEYYVYQYVRKDGTPYYIGKGKDKRAWSSHKRSNGAQLKPKDISRIQIIKENLTEQEAWSLETALIAKYKIKSDGGILVNIKEGGQGGTPSKAHREYLSKKLKGKKKPPRTKEHIRNHKLASEARRGTRNLKTAKGLKKWYSTNPDRSAAISKQSNSLKEWYETADKSAKAWNTWHTRYSNDYNEYKKAIQLLQTKKIAEVEKLCKFKRDTLRKLKNVNHGVYNHFPELADITT